MALLSPCVPKQISCFETALLQHVDEQRKGKACILRSMEDGANYSSLLVDPASPVPDERIIPMLETHCSVSDGRLPGIQGRK
jgi:hypothetical protein